MSTGSRCEHDWLRWHWRHDLEHWERVCIRCYTWATSTRWPELGEVCVVVLPGFRGAR